MSQDTLFSMGNDADGKPVESKTPPVKKAIPKSVQPSTIYGGLTAKQLWEKLCVWADGLGVDVCHSNHGWGGAGTIEMWVTTWEKTKEILEELQRFSTEFSFRADVKMTMHLCDTHGFRYSLRSVVPAPITVDRH